MRRLIILLTICLGTLVGHSQTYSNIIPDSEIVSFLTWEIKSTDGYSEESFLSPKRKIFYRISDWDTLNFIKPDTLNDYEFLANLFFLYQDRNKLDTIFNQEDRDFIFQQFTDIKDTLWQHKFPKAIITDKKNKKRPSRYYYSLPLFSKDKKHVIIKREYYCGSLCAHGGYFIYKRLDDKTWKLVTVVNRWVS